MGNTSTARLAVDAMRAAVERARQGGTRVRPVILPLDVASAILREFEAALAAPPAAPAPVGEWRSADWWRCRCEGYAGWTHADDRWCSFCETQAPDRAAGERAAVAPTEGA